MSAQVSLTVLKGKDPGTIYNFDERTTRLIGRGQDCNPRLPDDKAHETISRNHCLLDINPPDIRIRDFGSLNGTFVNGKKIGQRNRKDSPDKIKKTDFPEYDLKDGDEIKLGGTLYKVGIHVSGVCRDCLAEIPPEELAESHVTGKVYRCETCRNKASGEGAGPEPVVKREPKLCANCSKDVSREIGEYRQGDFICSECKAKPDELVKLLLDKANKGDKRLVALHGYSLISPLGQGATSAVYLAEHNDSGKKAALKMLLPEVAVNDRARQMFLREVEITKALEHPNVVQMIGSGDYSGIFFFTLEYCDIGSLDVIRKKAGGKLPLKQALTIIMQALTGLEYIHTAEIDNVKLSDGRTGKSRGLVHRDLKPANIFLTNVDGKKRAKIADVGVGKAFDTAGLSGHTRTGSVGGTPVYMPRQQVINFKYAKPDVDVWAMAATLYNLVTGAFPRDFKKGEDPWRVVLQSPPVPIRNRDKAIPAKIAEVIDMALIDQPTITFKSAIEFKRALEGVT